MALTEWFFEKYMVLNQKMLLHVFRQKYQQMLSLNSITCFQKIEKRKAVLNITIDNKLTFDSQIKIICRKAGQ